MEINGNKITFEVEDRVIDLFLLSSKLLGKTPDQCFMDYVDQLAKGALNNEKNQDSSGKAHPSIDLNHRISGWARKKDGYAYKMLHVYFVLLKEGEESVKRADMEKKFDELYCPNDKNKTISTFLMTFRQMSSSSIRAYGPVFIYRYGDHSDQVILNPICKDLVTSLKDEFE